MKRQLAPLTLGLVRPWGERVPSWVPRWGGRPVPTMAVVLPASVGAALITFINWTSALMWFGPENNGDPDAPHGLAGFVMAACYAPLVAWGPLLGIVTVAYYVRRRRHSLLPRPSRRDQAPAEAGGHGLPAAEPDDRASCDSTR